MDKNTTYGRIRKRVPVRYRFTAVELGKGRQVSVMVEYRNLRVVGHRLPSDSVQLSVMRRSALQVRRITTQQPLEDCKRQRLRGEAATATSSKRATLGLGD